MIMVGRSILFCLVLNRCKSKIKQIAHKFCKKKYDHPKWKEDLYWRYIVLEYIYLTFASIDLNEDRRLSIVTVHDAKSKVNSN